MPTTYTDVIPAVLARYDGLTFSGKPAIWFDEAPLRDGTGAAVAPPYVVLHDEGTTGEFDTELNGIETTRVRLEVYATTLAQAAAVVLGVRFNGAAPATHAGLDHGPLADLSGLTWMSTLWQGTQYFQEGARSTDGKPVYRATVRYTVGACRLAAGG